MILNEVAQYKENYDRAWRTSDDVLEALEPLLDTFRPRGILEMGPGFSSLVLATWAERNGAAYFAIDHEGPYAEKHTKLMEDLGWSGPRIYPLNPQTKWYEIPEKDLDFFESMQYDFVFIDGPAEGRDSAPALEFARRLAKSARLWLIDDVHRTAERSSLFKIERMSPVPLQRSLIFDRNFPRISAVLFEGRESAGFEE